MMKGLWKEISNKYKNEKNITIISLDRKIMSKLNKNLHIEMVPTIIFYKKGIKQFEFLSISFLIFFKTRVGPTAFVIN